MAAAKRFVVCVANSGYEAALERRKLYEVLRDPAGGKHGLLRIVDESGDSYLYPSENFVAIELPQPLRRAVVAAA